MTNEVCNLSFVNKKNSQRSERKRTQKKVDEALQTIVENMRILEGEESLDVKVKVTGYLYEAITNTINEGKAEELHSFCYFCAIVLREILGEAKAES